MPLYPKLSRCGLKKSSAQVTFRRYPGVMSLVGRPMETGNSHVVGKAKKCVPYLFTSCRQIRSALDSTISWSICGDLISHASNC